MSFLWESRLTFSVFRITLFSSVCNIILLMENIERGTFFIYKKLAAGVLICSMKHFIHSSLHINIFVFVMKIIAFVFWRERN